MSRIIFLNRYFPPDQSATSQLVGDLACYLAAAGYEVSVVTSQQLYDKPDVRLPGHEVINSVRVHRVLTTRFGRSNHIGRAIDYASYYVSARHLLSSLVKAGDTIIAMTDPPLISSVAASVAKHRRAHLVNWLQDIYPETAIALDVPLIKGPLAHALVSRRNRSLKLARANVVVGERMADTLVSLDIPKRSIHIIPNWTEDDQIEPVSADHNPLRRAWGLQGKFVFGYSGNLGRAHDYQTVLNAAEILHDHLEIVFLFIGGGYHSGKLAKAVKDRGLTNFRFLGYQNQSILNYSLAAPDVHWLSLNPKLEGLIVPSKFYGIAAAGRPIVAICTKDGEIARLVQAHGCGLVVEPGSSRELADTILRLHREPELREILGRRARAMIEQHFTREQAFNRWRDVLRHQQLHENSGLAADSSGV